MDNFSVYLPGILMAYSAFLLGIASPGPNVLAVIGTSMGVGRGPAMALALGIATGSFCWATLAVLRLTALLSTYASALMVIKSAAVSISFGSLSRHSNQPLRLMASKPKNDLAADGHHGDIGCKASLFR